MNNTKMLYDFRLKRNLFKKVLTVSCNIWYFKTLFSYTYIIYIYASLRKWKIYHSAWMYCMTSKRDSYSGLLHQCRTNLANAKLIKCHTVSYLWYLQIFYFVTTTYERKIRKLRYEMSSFSCKNNFLHNLSQNKRAVKYYSRVLNKKKQSKNYKVYKTKIRGKCTVKGSLEKPTQLKRKERKIKLTYLWEFPCGLHWLLKSYFLSQLCLPIL